VVEPVAVPLSASVDALPAEAGVIVPEMEYVPLGEEGEEGDVVVLAVFETLPHPERNKSKAPPAKRSFRLA
jgi:hypothetical protein